MHRNWRKSVSKISLVLFIVFSLLVLPMLWGQAPVRAQGGLTLGTAYTGITVKAGEVVQFPLTIKNSGAPSQVVELSMESMPQGWEGFFEGEGRVVHKVFVNNNDSQELDFKVRVPSDVAEGSYQINLKATGQGAGDTLTLDLVVSEEIHGAGKLVSQYPELQGPASATFKFRVDLTNDSSKERLYSLGANTPEGWEVSFIPSYDQESKVASISLDAGKSQGLDVQVKPAQQVKAGTYTIPIAAQSADETLTTELQVIITGTYKVTLTTPTGRLNAEAYAGREQSVTLDIVNEGSADLKDVTLSSSEPSNWSVTFSPGKLDSLAAGETQQVKALIKPDSKAIAGDYVISIAARTAEAQGNAEFRVMVKTPTTWGLVGIIIILAIVVGLLYIFKVFGRR